ncbi:MAG: lytic transglycosylase domain-containing protein [Pseudomonadota bacterium]|nr:lytic transglycosylase domain-containing protein [Pseudomonadota bacterium]
MLGQVLMWRNRVVQLVARVRRAPGLAWRNLPIMLALGVGTSTVAQAATVYRSEQPDGSVRFSSQRLDAADVLYSTEPAPPRAAQEKKPVSGAGQAARRAALEPVIRQLTDKHGIDGALVRAVIEVESEFRPEARSAAGAFGPMQLMPQTALRYGVTDRRDPVQNIDAGIRYLKDLLTRHHGSEALALASYNAGEGAVERHARRIPPYRETMLYVAAVLARAQRSRNLTSP